MHVAGSGAHARCGERGAERYPAGPEARGRVKGRSFWRALVRVGPAAHANLYPQQVGRFRRSTAARHLRRLGPPSLIFGDPVCARTGVCGAQGWSSLRAAKSVFIHLPTPRVLPRPRPSSLSLGDALDPRHERTAAGAPSSSLGHQVVHSSLQKSRQVRSARVRATPSLTTSRHLLSTPQISLCRPVHRLPPSAVFFEAIFW